MTDEGPVYLLDGSSLVYRAFFALPDDLATSSGTVTNAVHGFVGMVTMLLRDHRPSAMAVAFDLSTPTFRDDVVPDYKANRAAVPDLLRPQFDLVHAVLDALGICRVVADGYEADDILATLATQGRDAGRAVVVVSGDRDTFQLVEDPLVRVLYTRRGMSDTVRYDEAAIEDRYGVRPSLYPLLAALRGDPSDNLAGVPGVGEKTAAKLAVTYGTLDAVFAHAGELSPRLRESVLANEEQVRRNAEVIPLVRDVPLPVGVDDLGLGRWDVDEAQRLFAELELRGAWSRLHPLLVGTTAAHPERVRPGADRAPVAGAPGQEPDSVGTGGGGHVPAGGAASGGAAALAAPVLAAPPGPVEAAAALSAMRASSTAVAVAARWEGDAGRSPLAGLGIAPLGVGAPADGALPAAAPTGGVWLDAGVLHGMGEPLRGALAEILGAGGMSVVAHGAKEMMRALLPVGIDIARLRLDTELAANLLDPSTGHRPVTVLGQQWLGTGGPEEPPGQLTLVGAGSDADLGGGPAAVALELALLGALVEPLEAAMQQAGLTVLHEEVERPLVRVLARMELAGIGVDAAELRRIAAEMADECLRLQAEVHRLAGVEFNVNSTPQLREVLYGTLGLTPGKKTKTGYSTDAQTLEKLRQEHPVVDTLLRYREVEKLRSTYGATLLAEIGPDGRIHATFHQIGARTGRLSSDRPNLHNIPVRTGVGMALRRAFVPAEGTRLLAADYDQIELRVIAHLAEDPGLVAAFEERRDVHRATAARVFGVPEDQVTAAQRGRAKMVSYGLAYGMEAYGLAQRLGISTEEARSILDAYFAAFPAVAAYMARAVHEARDRGYTETALGRRRPLPDLVSSNRGLRMAAERQAMNAAVQGLAADLFKMALVRLDAALQQRDAPGERVVLQVHDEVLVEAPVDAAPAVEELVVAAMTGVGEAVGMHVPLEVSTGWGGSWAGAKG